MFKVFSLVYIQAKEFSIGFEPVTNTMQYGVWTTIQFPVGEKFAKLQYVKVTIYTHSVPITWLL